MLIQTAPNIREKLALLSQSSQYDLACACSGKNEPRRVRSADDRWIYPVVFPDGRKTFLFKTLISNSCANDCAYCPLRADQDSRRLTAGPEEIAKAFMDYYQAGTVSGLFLSSGVTGSPDNSMDRINQVARILRKREKFRGYIHLKVIPGASSAAVEESVSLASAVSINLEVPGERNFRLLTAKKDYLKDVIAPLTRISQLTAQGERYQRVKQTTQFVVGASTETDRELVEYTGALYDRLKLHRIFFSAYQRGAGRPDIPGETSTVSNDALLTREHRLYQVDYLLRKYGFKAKEIPLDSAGALSLTVDPKEAWARQHLDLFPLDLNRAGEHELLRVPGLGPVTVKRLLKIRQAGSRVRRLEDLGGGKVDKRLKRAVEFVKFG